MRKLVKQIQKLIDKAKYEGDKEYVVLIVEKMNDEECADLSALITSKWAKKVSIHELLYNVFHDLQIFRWKYLEHDDRCGVPRSEGYSKLKAK